MSIFLTLAILSTPQFSACLKIEGSPLVDSQKLEPFTKVDKGVASLSKVEADEGHVIFEEGKSSSVPTNLHSVPVDIGHVESEAAAAVKMDVAAPGPQSAMVETEKIEVAGKKQIARGRGAQSDVPDVEKSLWIDWFKQQSYVKLIGLGLFLLVGIVVCACWLLDAVSALQSRCSPKEDSVLEEAWKPKQDSEPVNPLMKMAGDTVASLTECATAAIDNAKKLADGQEESVEEIAEERQPRVAPRYSRRHVYCPWPTEPESPANQEPAKATAQEAPCLLSTEPTVSKVQLEDELGTWIPHVKDVDACMAESDSQEDSTSAGESEQALLEKLKEVASDGEDESVSPRHLGHHYNEQNLDEI